MLFIITAFTDTESVGRYRTVADIPRAYHGVAFVNGYVYVIGGFDGSNYFNSVRKMNVSTFEWTQVGKATKTLTKDLINLV